MSEENKDLLRYASEYAEKVDLYELLGIDALTPKDGIRRAWRQVSTKYHPDKLGDKYDAEKWELIERARDILSDPGARLVYDESIKAQLLRKQEREAMNKEHKKFADDLEARENAAKTTRQDRQEADRLMLEKERERLAELQRTRDEETRRQAEAAQEMEDLAEARRRIKEKKDEKARRKQAKESMKATLESTKRPTGPANGTIISVPGEYVTESGKQYWELVCDKLRGVQAVRNLQEGGLQTNELQQAEKGVDELRQSIHEAELKYQRETTVL